MILTMIVFYATSHYATSHYATSHYAASHQATSPAFAYTPKQSYECCLASDCIINMQKPYKEKYTFEQRAARVKGFQESEPDKIMVIVEKHPKSKLPPLANNRFLTFKNFKFAQVKNLIEKRIRERVSKEKEGKQSFFIFVNGSVPNMEDTMEAVYQRFKDTDGIMYISYQEQESF